MIRFRPLLAALLVTAAPASAAVTTATVERTEPGMLAIRWQAVGSVDVYMAPRPDAAPQDSKLVSKGDRDGVHMLADDGTARPYFLLKDAQDGKTLRVAERLLPLERGSNFRDIGGYRGFGGKHVRWGRIYRSGAMPMLSEKDYTYLGGLGLGAIVDLRSMDERQIAPTTLDDRTGALYIVNDYSAKAMTRPATATVQAGNLYRDMPVLLAPQFRAIFTQLLDGKGAVAYNCSAGQDRTGVGTALILAALGVPREVILKDYHLSTGFRRPENEMPKIDPADYPGNAFLALYGKYMMDPEMRKPRPLYTADGQPYLASAFDAIDTRWGSVEKYLDQVLGVDAVDLAALRAEYLE